MTPKRGLNQHCSLVVLLLISIESDPITCRGLLREPAEVGGVTYVDAGSLAAASDPSHSINKDAR
jgi:hypothetical protein